MPDLGRGARASKARVEGAGLEHGRRRHVRVIGGAGGLVEGVQSQDGHSCDYARRCT